jgi:isoleucyl-tRNA synthetase
VSEIKELLLQIVDENDDWGIARNRGWGTDCISIETTKDIEDTHRASIRIHKDSGSQLRITKEVQKLEEWESIEIDDIDVKVEDKVVYEEKKETVGDRRETEDLVAKWKQEADTEIKATDFKSIIVSEDLADD